MRPIIGILLKTILKLVVPNSQIAAVRRRALKKQGFLEKMKIKLLSDLSKYGWDDNEDVKWTNDFKNNKHLLK